MQELWTADSYESVSPVRDTCYADSTGQITLSPVYPVRRRGGLSDPDCNKHAIAIGNRVQSSENILRQVPLPAVSRIGEETHKINTVADGDKHAVAEGHTCELGSERP